MPNVFQALEDKWTVFHLLRIQRALVAMSGPLGKPDRRAWAALAQNAMDALNYTGPHD